jgi:Raf kinase inhibitor-like YbhB/YbcL family protein
MPSHDRLPLSRAALAVVLGSLAWACSSSPGHTNGETGGSGGEETGGAKGDTGGKGGSGTGGKGTGGSTATGGSTGTGGSVDTGGSSGSTGGSNGSTGGSSGSTGGSSGTPDAGADSGAMGGMSGGTFAVMGDFLDKGTYLCWKDGNTRNTGQMSPEIKWSGVPDGTMSIAVSLKDLTNQGIHWVIWNLPPTATSLPAGLPKTMLPAGASQSNAWYGPGATLHRYEWQVWALKVPMLPANSAKATLYNTTLPAQKIASVKLFACGDQDAKCGACGM